MDTSSTPARAISRRSFAALLAGGLASLTLADAAKLVDLGVARARADENGDISLIVKADGDPASFNPDTLADDTFLPIAANIFHRLVKLDLANNLLPDAAESWEISDDSLTVTFHLRSDLTWTDGTPLTAEDARYTFETIRTTNAYFFCSYLAAVESIEAPDDTTLVFHMASPDIALVTNLGWYASFIMPKHVYDVEGVDWRDNEAAQLANPDKVVSSGPYRISEFVQGQSVTIVANESCPIQPAIKTIVFSVIPDEATAIQALLNGEIDVYAGMPSTRAAEVEAAGGIVVTSQVNPTPLRMIFNMSDERLTDVAVRRAIAMCVDRDDISVKVSAGAMPPDNCMYPPVIEWCSNTTDVAPDCDLAAAEQCLIDAGYTKDENGYYVSGLEIDTFEFAGLPDICKLVVSNMGADRHRVRRERAGEQRLVGQVHVAQGVLDLRHGRHHGPRPQLAGPALQHRRLVQRRRLEQRRVRRARRAGQRRGRPGEARRAVPSGAGNHGAGAADGALPRLGGLLRLRRHLQEPAQPDHDRGRHRPGRQPVLLRRAGVSASS